MFVVVFSIAFAVFWATYDQPRVNIRWREGVTSSTRAELEARHQLTDPRHQGATTWSYALANTSAGNIRELLQDPNVDDTHGIDRTTFELIDDKTPVPLSGPLWFIAWSTLIAAGSVAVGIWMRRRPWARLGAALQRAAAVSATPIVTLGNTVRSAVQASGVPRAILEATSRLPSDSGRFWTTAVIVASAPLVIVLCVTLWRTPFPITEIVALLEDVENLPITHYLNPDATYYRPLYQIALSGIWNNGAALETRLGGIKLLTIVPVALLVLLFIWHVRPRTAVEAVAAALAVAVLIGSGGFRDNLEIGLTYTIVGMLLALIAWVLLNRERRSWQTPVVIALTLVAIGFKEQGLVLVPLVLIAWWTGAPGASRGMALAAAAIGVAYVVLRLSATGTWEVFEQDIGLGFIEMDRFAAAARFGDFPYWIYAYNGASTVANVLFAEPTRGIFRIVHAAIDDNLEPWHVVYLGSSVTLTGVIVWWGVRSVRNALRTGWSLESRLFVATVVVVLASGALSFNYSRDRLAGMAVVFYAVSAFFAMRAAMARISSWQGARFAAVAFALALVAAGWQMRAVATIEWTRGHSNGNQREWLVLLAKRRVDFGRRATYQRIMESMIAQGTDPGAPRPTQLPDWAQRVLGQ